MIEIDMVGLETEIINSVEYFQEKKIFSCMICIKKIKKSFFKEKELLLDFFGYLIKEEYLLVFCGLKFKCFLISITNYDKLFFSELKFSVEGKPFIDKDN